jgi:hypothetical protein
LAVASAVQGLTDALGVGKPYDGEEVENWKMKKYFALGPML